MEDCSSLVIRPKDSDSVLVLGGKELPFNGDILIDCSDCENPRFMCHQGCPYLRISRPNRSQRKKKE